MKASTYHLIRKIHLYASLPVIALLLMYVISSYFMIHYQFFGTYDRQESKKEVTIDKQPVTDSEWEQFLESNQIRGKLTDESTNAQGDRFRAYERAGISFELRLPADEPVVEIVQKKGDFPAFMVGLHRIRGFEGPWQYKVYGVLLDLVGVSLILFAITGAILWLHLLKRDRIAWIIFIAGFVYVAAIIVCLMVI